MGPTTNTRKISFTKMAGAGNDFIMVNNVKDPVHLDWQAFAISACASKTGISADGVIILGEDKDTDFTFRIFNADGSEAEMCGNGARCAALFARQQGIAQTPMRFKTPAGTIGARIDGEDIAIRMTEPFGLETGIALDAPGGHLTAHFINTGVPHAVIYSDAIDNVPIADLGRAVRFHSRFSPAGTNADFVQVEGGNRIRVRTYERGVEDETLACGTGAVAAAIISVHLGKVAAAPVLVAMRGGELKIDFIRQGDRYTDVWLMGPVDTVFTGEVIVRQ
jgi:diaminopimelate epimerase